MEAILVLKMFMKEASFGHVKLYLNTTKILNAFFVQH